MKPGEVHILMLTSEQLGYVETSCRQMLKKDRKGANKFGDDLDLDSSLAHRLRVGGDVKVVMAVARLDAEGGL